MYLRPFRNTGLRSVCFVPLDLIAAEIDGVLAIDNVCLAEARRAEDQHGIPERSAAEHHPCGSWSQDRDG